MSAALTISTTVDDAYVLQALRDTRRALNQDVKRVLERAALAHALPAARRNAPAFLRGIIAVKPTTRTVMLTVTGPRLGRLQRAAGLLEFGGVVRVPLRPKNAKALKFNGRYAARVQGVRRYAPKGFLQAAAIEARPAIMRDLRVDITHLIQERIDHAAHRVAFA